jgi:hypothetical protein
LGEFLYRCTKYGFEAYGNPRRIAFGVYAALQSNPVVDMVAPGDLGRVLGLMWAFAGVGALISLPIPAQIQNELGVEAMGFYTGN